MTGGERNAERTNGHGHQWLWPVAGLAGAAALAGWVYRHRENLGIAVRGGRMALRGRIARRLGAVVRDVRFAEHSRLRLDVYIPGDVDTSRPVVMFAHGGAFVRFDKEFHALVGRALQASGCVGVLMNYRLFPEVTFPTFVEDVAASVDWVHENIARYGGDPARVALAGHSAGAIMTSLLALDGDRYGLPEGALRAAVCMSGLYDYEFLNSWPHWVTLMGGEENYNGPAQPIRAVGESPRIPLLILHGARDQLIPPENPAAFYEALCRVGADASLHIYPEMDHYDPLFALSDPRSDVFERVLSFVRERLGEADVEPGS